MLFRSANPMKFWSGASFVKVIWRGGQVHSLTIQKHTELSGCGLLHLSHYIVQQKIFYALRYSSILSAEDKSAGTPAGLSENPASVNIFLILQSSTNIE